LPCRRCRQWAVAPELEKAIYKFNLLAMTAQHCFSRGFWPGLILGIRPLRLGDMYLRCLWRVRVPLATIAVMLALGYTTKFCGSDSRWALPLPAPGGGSRSFSPLLGWLGVALTGSDTSSNVLFGNLQKVTAGQLGLSPILCARLEQFRRCDGQNDRRAEHCCGERGDWRRPE
jgi:lactate permease